MNYYGILDDLKHWLETKKNRLGEGVEVLILVSDVLNKIDELECEHE